MLRGTPSSYASSQPTLLTSFQSGTGTPEEEEELALLQHLEQQRQQNGGGTQWDEPPRMMDAAARLPSAGGADDFPPEDAYAEDGAWAPESAFTSGGSQPGGPLPAENDPPQSAWHPDHEDENAGAGDPAANSSAPYPAQGSQEAAWGQPAGMDEGQAPPLSAPLAC